MQAYRKGNPKPAAKLIDLSEVINLRSNQQLKQATENYFKEYNQRHKAKLDPPVNFSAKTLKGMLGEMPDEINEDLLKPLLVFKKSSKLIDAFGEKLLEMVNPVTGRLHGNWKQIGTATGRPTCAKPNLLQMPSDGSFRSCFVAAAGYLLVVADFSQIELRIMAELSNDATFIDAFVSGKDLHRLTASNIYHLPPEEINDKQRKVAKIVNFATLYGIGPKGLLTQIVAEGQKMTKAEAAQALDGWRKTYPQAAELIEKWGYQAVKLGYTTTAFGRRRNFNIYGEMNLEIEGIIKRAGANHPIQGTNADMTKLAMVGINDRLATYGCRIVAQVYDEIITEVPEDKAAFAASVIKETMVAAAKPVLKTVPVAVDTTISKTWNEKDGFSLEDLEAE
jgi:DNA polymerase I-like protein with 3'-5' exonuclease and polymerase domains